MQILFIIFLSLLFALTIICQTSASVAICSTPKQILIEKTKNGQELSFDFLLENKTESNLELTKINVSVFNKNGNLVVFRNKGERNEDWLGFGTLVLAPASGVVKKIRNTVDDNILGQKMFDFRLVFQDIKAFYGNYIIIDHQNGEYSLLLHLKKGSVSVKVGDKIKQGQPIAQMGISGDSEYVHLTLSTAKRHRSQQ